jgi:predicted ATPase
MFTEIGIENFKAFGKMQHIPLKPITLLYGPNSSGKSSFIQSLLLFKQTLEESSNDEVILLSRGNLVDLGDYSEFIHKHDDKREFNISFSFNFLWEPEVHNICQNSAPLREEENIKLEFSFLKDKTGNVIVKTIRLFYRLNPEPLLVYKNVLLDPKLGRRIRRKYGKELSGDLFYKAILCLESINFNSEFIKANWDYFAQYYRNSAKSAEETFQMDFSGDLHLLESLPIDTEAELKARKKILRHLEKIERSFKNNSFENFLTIGMPPNDRIIKLAKCFPSVLVGRSHYWNFVKMSWLYDYASLFDRQVEYTQIIPVDFILTISGLLSQYLNKIIYIGPLRAFPGRAYSFSGNVGADVGKSGKYMPDILFKRPDIVEKVNHWFNKFEMGYELKIESFKRNLFAINLIDKKNGCEVSPTDVGFGISQLLPIIVQGALPDYICPGYKIICIEQPEIHLHPRLQAELGSFFADCIDKSPPSNEINMDSADINGNQFIIETHSENLILRLQKLIRKGELRKEHVAVIYFDKTSEGTEVKELRLNDKGEFIDPWPNGFFEESFKEMFGE